MVNSYLDKLNRVSEVTRARERALVDASRAAGNRLEGLYMIDDRVNGLVDNIIERSDVFDVGAVHRVPASARGQELSGAASTVLTCQKVAFLEIYIMNLLEECATLQNVINGVAEDCSSMSALIDYKGDEISAPRLPARVEDGPAIVVENSPVEPSPEVGPFVPIPRPNAGRALLDEEFEGDNRSESSESTTRHRASVYDL